MNEIEWGVRDLSGILGPEPFKMPSRTEAEKFVGNDPLAVVVSRAPGGEWMES